MINKKVFLSFLLILYFSLIIKSQDTLSFSECLKIGIEQNYAIRIVRNNEEISVNNLKYAFGGYLPTSNISVRQNYSIVNSDIVINAGNTQIPQTRENANQNNFGSGINLNWTVFDGLGMFYRYDRLEELNEAGMLNTRMNVENLISQLGSLYYNFLQQSKRLETFKYVMGLSRERMNIAYERYRIGRESKLEFQQAKVDYNADSSQYMQQQQNLFSAKIRLNETLATQLDTMVIIHEAISVDFNLEYDNLRSQTFDNNTELLIASNNKTLSGIDLQIINSRVYPEINLFGSYNYNRIESEYGNVASNYSNGFTYGASLSFNLLDQFDITRQRNNAKISVENSQLQIEQVEQQVLADLSIMYNTYQNSLKLVMLEESNLKIARENFDIATERFNLGTMSGLEMRDIQRVFLDAEDRLLAAQYQAKMAEISLKQVSGRVSEYL